MPPRRPLYLSFRGFAQDFDPPNILHSGIMYIGMMVSPAVVTSPRAQALAWQASVCRRTWPHRYRFDPRSRVNADPGSDADLDQLADCLVAAFHGGILGTQAARDITALRDALYGAIARVESHIPEAKIAAAEAGNVRVRRESESRRRLTAPSSDELVTR
jgi:hypothetical protein